MKKKESTEISEKKPFTTDAELDKLFPVTADDFAYEPDPNDGAVFGDMVRRIREREATQK